MVAIMPSLSTALTGKSGGRVSRWVESERDLMILITLAFIIMAGFGVTLNHVV